MFADSFYEPSWDVRSRRAYTTLITFAVEILAVGMLLLIPLFAMHGLPALRNLSGFVIVPPPAASPAAPAHREVSSSSNLNHAGQLVAPHSIPTTIVPINESVAPPAVDVGSLGVQGGIGDRYATSGVIGSIGTGLANIAPPPPQPTAQPPRISQMMEGNLIYRVQPQYPTLARQARVQGTVVLHAVISREGRIRDLQFLSGHPMLASAAIDAVRQWRYRPYILNGEPVEVETEITVNFTLGG